MHSFPAEPLGDRQQSVDLVIVSSCDATVDPVPARRHRVLLLAVVGVVAAGCGSSELDLEPTFDGAWIVTTLEVHMTAADGADDTGLLDAIGAPLLVEIDTGEAALRGQTGCGRLFGSYTLLGDGTDGGEASFTIPSPAANSDCPADERRAHEALVNALEQVSQWRQEGTALVFQGPDSTMLELSPAG